MRTKSKLRQLLAYVLSFVFTVTAAENVWGFDFFKKEEIPTYVSPKMKMYARCEPVEINLGATSVKTANADVNEAKKLYDGDKETVFVAGQHSDIILDLGKKHVLAGVKFTPETTTAVNSANRAAGTRFYVSKDNRTFTEAAVAEPESGSYAEETKEIMFGSIGEFRYVKAGIPSGAGISEIQWLEYPEWSYSGKKMDITLRAFDVQESINADVITAVYNSNGVMKAISKTEQNFEAEQQKDISLEIKGISNEQGDSSRVGVWTEEGKLALERMLKFRYADTLNGFSVSNVFSDDMLIQRDKPFVVWGKAPVNSSVVVILDDGKGQKIVKYVKADGNPDWEVDMGTFPKGGSYTLTVSCDGEKNIYKNITFGDVWLLAGQSNMEYYMLCGKDTTRYLRSREGKKDAENPDIRLLNLLNKGIEGAGEAINNLPANNGEKLWMSMSRDVANYCSAIGYYFAQEIQREFNVPVGLIAAAVGDTEINRWLPKDFSYGEFTGTDGNLYNNRIEPLKKLNICGILWYQGEADEYRTNLSTKEYCDAMTGLVEHYREIWGEELPFYWAQITRYGAKDASKIRNAQRMAYDAITNKTNAGVISLMDVYGVYDGGTGSCREDIHPYQKKEAAERFALLAKRDVYDKPDTVVSGPKYKSMEAMGNGKIEITFECTGNLSVMPKENYIDKVGDKLVKQNKLNTATLQEFEVAGEDGIFVRANAEINGSKVIVYSDRVTKPLYVRYAWGGYPEMPNLTDESGLPALSFSTYTDE